MSLLVVKCSIFLLDFNHIWSFLTYLRRKPKYKFHGNPLSDSRADSCRREDGQTDREEKAN